jgi:hypothetical protein
MESKPSSSDNPLPALLRGQQQRFGKPANRCRPEGQRCLPAHSSPSRLRRRATQHQQLPLIQAFTEWAPKPPTGGTPKRRIWNTARPRNSNPRVYYLHRRAILRTKKWMFQCPRCNSHPFQSWWAQRHALTPLAVFVHMKNKTFGPYSRVPALAAAGSCRSWRADNASRIKCP